MFDWIKRKIGTAKAHQLSPPDYRIPVLCYHSWRIDSTDYNQNDHVALESDLQALAARGYQVLPLTVLIDLLDGLIPARMIHGKKVVCLTFDDGTDYDYYDHQVEKVGFVRSIANILKDSISKLPLIADGPRAVSFVIASPNARATLDTTCNAGNRGWGDSWWKESAEGGLLGIGNHSWDHVHDTLPSVSQRDNLKGSFHNVDTFEDAQNQIENAQRYINEITGGNALPVFGYPYGHVSAYLRDEYFPEFGGG